MVDEGRVDEGRVVFTLETDENTVHTFYDNFIGVTSSSFPGDKRSTEWEWHIEKDCILWRYRGREVDYSKWVAPWKMIQHIEAELALTKILG